MSVNLGTAVGYLDLDTSKFKKGFKDATSAVEQFKKGTGGVSGLLKSTGSALTSIGKDATLKITGPILAIGTAVTKTAADLEKGLSKVKAISGASSADIVDLKNKAIEMGAKTKFSASEAADAFTYMAMAGWDAQQMMDGIDGIMNLAAADGLDLATTSDIVTDALTAFGLQASDSAHFADVLAKASSSANTNVAMLGESFKYVAPVAGSLGYTVEDVSTALGLMANSGIKASQGGTALRAALSRMIKPTDNAAAAMDRYNLSLTNKDGTMKSLSEVMDMLRQNMGSLSEAEQANAAATIFGQEAMSGMLAIINASSNDYDKLTDAIKNADGTAQDMANTMIDNLAGQFVIIKSTLESIAIAFGDILLPYIKQGAVYLQQFLDWLNSLDEQQKKNIVTIAAVVASIGPAILILGKVISLVGTAMSVIKKMGTVIGLLTSPVGIAVIAIGTLVTAFVVLWNKSEAFRNFWISLWNGLKNTVSTVVDAIVGFFTKTLPNGLKSAEKGIKEFPDNVVKFFENLPKNIGFILGYVIGTVLKWRQQMNQKAKEVGKAFVETLINFVKELPGKIKDWFTKTVEKAKSFGKEFAQEAKNAASDFSKMFVNTMKQIPSKAKEIGKNILNGVVNGIKERFENAKKAVTDFASGLVDGFKTALDIHSPSRVMKKEVGEQVANGVIEGIKAKKGAAKKSASELSQEIVDAASKKLDALQTYNKITTSEEIAFWKKIYDETVKGTDANLTAYKNYKSAQENLNKEILSNAEKKLDRLQTYNKLSAADEVVYWKTTMSTLAKGSDEYLTAYKNYVSAKKTYNDELKSIETEYKNNVSAVYDDLKEKIKSLTDAYNEQVKSRKEALLSAFSLFDEYSVASDKSGEDLQKALQSQVTALSDYNTQMQTLEERGLLPKGLISELKEMGVSANGELQALNQMTDDQLKQYAALWKERNRLAKEEAERENQESYERLQTKITKAQNLAYKKLANYDTKYQKKLKEMAKTANDNSFEMGKKTVDGIISGIKDKEVSLNNTLNNVLQTVNGYMNRISIAVANAAAMASSIGAVASSAAAGRSHRQGLTYVPYDGYHAVLHEGEQVLTKEEAKNKSGNGDTFIFNSPKAIDEKEAARQMKIAKQQLILRWE